MQCGNGKTFGTVTFVLQRSCASLAGGGKPSVQRDVEEGSENPAVQLSTTTQLCLHLIQTKHLRPMLRSGVYNNISQQRTPLASKYFVQIRCYNTFNATRLQTFEGVTMQLCLYYNDIKACSNHCNHHAHFHCCVTLQHTLVQYFTFF